MKSVITSKYQTTIPKRARDQLKLSVNDALEWRVVKGQMVVYPLQKRFLLRRNSIRTGPGDVREDIEKARRETASVITAMRLLPLSAVLIRPSESLPSIAN